MLKSIKIWIKEYEEKLNYAENVLEYNATENRLNELKKLAKKGIKYLSLSQVNRLFQCVLRTLFWFCFLSKPDT